MYIAGSGQRLEHLDIHRVRRGEPVHEEPLRQGHIDHAAADRVHGRGDQFRQAGRPYPCPDQPPQARLPDVCFGKGASIGPDVLSVHPGPDHLRPAPGVAGEQSGDLAGRSQPLAVAQRIYGIRGVDEAGQKPHPRLAEVIVHHRDHGAGQSGSLPGIQRRSQFGNRSEHVPDEAARGGKLDVGTHPVAGRPVSQFGGDPLGEPALDTARRYGHHLLSEGIGRRQGQLLAQPAHQLVGMRPDVDQQRHGVSGGRQQSTGDSGLPDRFRACVRVQVLHRGELITRHRHIRDHRQSWLGLRDPKCSRLRPPPVAEAGMTTGINNPV